VPEREVFVAAVHRHGAEQHFGGALPAQQASEQKDVPVPAEGGDAGEESETAGVLFGVHEAKPGVQAGGDRAADVAEEEREEERAGRGGAGPGGEPGAAAAEIGPPAAEHLVQRHEP